MSTVAQLVVGGVTGAVLAALSVAGLFAALRPWARAEVRPAAFAGSTVVRLILVLLGLAVLIALGRPAFLAGALALVATRPMLVRWLAPRLAQSDRGPAP